MYLNAVLLVVATFSCFVPALAGGRGKVNLYWVRCLRSSSQLACCS